MYDLQTIHDTDQILSCQDALLNHGRSLALLFKNLKVKSKIKIPMLMRILSKIHSYCQCILGIRTSVCRLSAIKLKIISCTAVYTHQQVLLNPPHFSPITFNSRLYILMLNLNPRVYKTIYMPHENKFLFSTPRLCYQSNNWDNFQKLIHRCGEILFSSQTPNSKHVNEVMFRWLH